MGTLTTGRVGAPVPGRHRATGHRPASLLMLEHPPGYDPPAHGGLDRTLAGGLPGVHRTPLPGPFASRRTMVLAAALVLAAPTAVAVALLNTTPAASHGASVPTAGMPLPALSPAQPTVDASPRPRPTPHRHHRPAKPSAAPAQAQVPARTPAPRTSSAAATRKLPIDVRYLVESQTANGFEGQVVVTNNTASPISDWQIVVALTGDVVTSVKNATGQFSNGVLLLQPGVSGQVLSPHGGRLVVSFLAEGFRTTPIVCSFNSTMCN